MPAAPPPALAAAVGTDAGASGGMATAGEGVDAGKSKAGDAEDHRRTGKELTVRHAND